ncbi:hypothetical protein ABZP36_031536 [Zizania latifolia]
MFCMTSLCVFLLSFFMQVLLVCLALFVFGVWQIYCDCSYFFALGQAVFVIAAVASLEYGILFILCLSLAQVVFVVGSAQNLFSVRAQQFFAKRLMFIMLGHISWMVILRKIEGNFLNNTHFTE